MNKELRRLTYRFKKKYPRTVVWRRKKHTEVVEKFINPGEEILYAFVGQENDNPLDIVTSCVVALTNKRILIGRKRLLFGFFYHSVTYDMFNDLEVKMGLIWGRIHIDTVKEYITISNLDPASLPEVETNITEIANKYRNEKKKDEE